MPPPVAFQERGPSSPRNLSPNGELVAVLAWPTPNTPPECVTLTPSQVPAGITADPDEKTAPLCLMKIGTISSRSVFQYLPAISLMDQVQLSVINVPCATAVPGVAS